MEDKDKKAEETASESPAEEQPTEESGETPADGGSDRTREQFEKLTEANKRLKEENEKLQKSEPQKSVLESLRPQDNFPNVSPQQAEQIAEGVFDEQGFVDPNLLNQKLAQAEEVARQAIQTAQQAQQQLRNFEETQQTQQVYIQYPQLNPNGENFDPQFYNRVRNELIGQMMQGKQDLMSAAKTVQESFVVNTQAQEKEEAEKSLKQQASSNLGTSQGASKPVDQDFLAEETRKGNTEALMERLRRAGA